MSEVGAPRSPSRLRSPGGSRRAIDGYFSYSLPEHFLIDSFFAEQLTAAAILGGGKGLLITSAGYIQIYGPCAF